MKKTILILSSILTLSCKADMRLSQDVFRQVPYSSQYSEDGALIRSIDFRSVNQLIPQLEERFQKVLKGRKLEDRNEAHITVITPPEGKTNFIPGRIGLDKVISNSELIEKYKGILQSTDFEITCIGMRTNPRGNVVFYLVVKSEEILNIRKEIKDLALSRDQDLDIPFEPVEGYYPHITIGFVGGDVHGVSKGPETCIDEKLELF